MAPSRTNIKPVKTPTVLQMEALECGAASLAMILGYYGKFVPLEVLRVACGVSRHGSTAVNIIKAARQFGLKAKGVKRSIDTLKTMQMPCIIFWNFNHYLILEGFKKGKALLNDPAQGRYSVDMEEFDASYTGVAMLFEPSETFEKGNDTNNFFYGLASRLKQYQQVLVFIVLASLLLIIPGLIIPSFIKIFIDQYLVNQHSTWVKPLLLGMSGILLLNVALTYIQQRYLLRLEVKLALSTSSKFFWHILSLPISFFGQRFAGEIGSRITLNDKIAHLLSGRLANSFLNAIVVLFYALVMFSYDWLMTTIGIVVAIINMIALRYVAARRKDSNRMVLNETGKLLGTTMNGIRMMETLKATGGESNFFSRWSGYLAKVLNAQQEFEWLTRRLNILPPLLTSLNSTAILGIGALRVMEGELTLGALVAFTYLMDNFIKPVNELVAEAGLFQEAEVDMNRIDDVLDYPTDPITAQENDNEAYNKLVGYVALQQVVFGYSEVSGALINGLDIEVTPGSRVALVGGSGSGKSTVAKIISGLEKPWEGQVLFDQQERSQIPKKIITASLSVVDQDIMLFEGTIRENISFWDKSITEESIIQAAKDALIHETISERAGGYDSKVAEGGGNFSGGQKQRLEIARALAREPSILIMDEATSALDPTTEKLLMDNIRRRGCTCLIVAHRLSTIRDCDEIIVLQKGKIVERGTHEQLLQQQGAYAQLISSE